METEEQPQTEAGRLIRDMEHQIEHLVRSNKELEEYMRENGEDKELRVAIGENIVTIARRRAMLDDLMRQAGLLPPAGALLQPVDSMASALPPAPLPSGPPPEKMADEGVYL